MRFLLPAAAWSLRAVHRQAHRIAAAITSPALRGGGVAGRVGPDIGGSRRVATTAAAATAMPRRRRARDPRATREAILEAARDIFAKDGAQGLSVSEVAARAGVNRGTAYQHFATRETLLRATVEWVSETLYRAVFGDPADAGRRAVETVDVPGLTDRLTGFAMDNPDLCRVWLLQVLASPDPADDLFWREYRGSIGRFADTDLAEPGVDAEVLTVIMLAGTFLWPAWTQAHGAGQGEGRTPARRFSDEVLRLSMYGSLRAACYPAIAGRLRASGIVREAE
jgi:AcrR family transcriptional regulator